MHETLKGKHQRGANVPKPVDVEVGARIRSRRRIIGLSQEKLGKALGVTFQQIQKYEKGTNRVGASRLQVIASVLGVPIEYFFGGNAGQKSGSSTHTDLLAVDQLTAFLQTTEAEELNAAFSKVKSPTVRMRVVSLVKAIAFTSLGEISSE
ncbi:hypothetical protein RU07_01700 [Agrobacterium tumefaciens]|uniref:HTH cro/C1-type domain-containing protein n=1 Tax=Agrobacterium tumefaciens TaxID=358 RepID=A0A0D0L454_AGRTU|nr:hypothetical protein RU07_01700 [Agrobacterium tumefaciens]